MSSQPNDDLALISSYKETRNPALVAQLMDKYSAQIVAFALGSLKNKEDVKDFTHDVYLKLCDKLLKEDVQNFRNWLSRFMKNMFLDQKRKEQVQKKHLNRLTTGESYSIDRELFMNMDKKLIHKAIAQLAERERECIRVLYLEGKHYKEMMAETGWTFNQIKGVRERATRKLRTILSADFDEMNR